MTAATAVLPLLQVIVARQGIGDHRVVAASDDHLVKSHVEIVMDFQVFYGHAPLPNS